MSTSRISILPLMSKWFFIPNIFSLYFFAFQLRLCRKRLTWSNGYLEAIFHALDVFSIIFATVYVEVKVVAHMGAILSGPLDFEMKRVACILSGPLDFEIKRVACIMKNDIFTLFVGVTMATENKQTYVWA